MNPAIEPTMTPVVISQYEKLNADIAILEDRDGAASFDYRTPTGNKAARSHLFALRSQRGAIEKARKEAKAYALEYGRRVDSAARELEARVDRLIAPHQQHIDAIEAAEQARKDAHHARLDYIASLGSIYGNSDEIRSAIVELKTIETDSMQEFAGKAAQSVLDRLRELDAALADALRREAEAAELAKLRAEAAEREERERVEAIKRQAIADERQRAEAAERKRVADEVAKRAAEEAAAKAESDRKEREAHAAIEAAERRELEAKLAKERAERERLEAIRRAEEAEARAKAEADRQAAEKAARIAAEQEAARRDAERRRDVARRIIAAIDGQSAHEIADAIIDGRVPHVSVTW